MFTFQGNVDYAIGRYGDAVQIGERRALQIAEEEPRRAAGRKPYWQALAWLGARWANRERSLLRTGAAPAHSG